MAKKNNYFQKFMSKLKKKIGAKIMRARVEWVRKINWIFNIEKVCNISSIKYYWINKHICSFNHSIDEFRLEEIKYTYTVRGLPNWINQVEKIQEKYVWLFFVSCFISKVLKVKGVLLNSNHIMKWQANTLVLFYYTFLLNIFWLKPFWGWLEVLLSH